MVDFNREKENDIDWKNRIHTEIINTYGNNLKDKDISNIINYYWQFAPISLYKYYSDTEQNLNNIKANKIWCSLVCNFKDVFDGTLPFNPKYILDSLWEQIPNNHIPEVKRLRESFDNKIGSNIIDIEKSFESLKDKMGISCFSESCESLLMWAHYANNHCGMCVQYSMIDMMGMAPVPIVYSDERIIVKSFNLHSQQTLLKSGFGYFMKSLMTKSNEWSYEKEWRVINPDITVENTWDENHKGALYEMVRPRSIILGCKAEPKFEEEVRDYCETSKINLYKMEKDPFRYKLNKKLFLSSI